MAKDKGIPPFLILHVAEHPDTTAQAQRLGNVLKDAGVPVTVFGARETTHNKINADLGKPDADVAIPTEAFLVVADADGRNARTIASDKSNQALNPIYGSVDWR